MDVGELEPAGVLDASELTRTGGVATFGARDAATGEAVIVKVLLREVTQEVRARFEHDQRQLVGLASHSNLVPVLRYGYTRSGQPYVVSASVAGGSMADQVGAGLDGPGVVHLGVRVAGALETAHRHHVVHGDLRPEDIRIDGAGEPRLGDLGIAMSSGWGPDRATDGGRLAHAAPEQLERHTPTVASDVYALGSVLYALLAGRAAFGRAGDSAVAVGMRIANDPVPDLAAEGVPVAVAAVITKAMAKDPAARWSSAEAMGLALQQAEVALGRPITPMAVVGSDISPPPPAPELEPEEEAPPPPPKPRGRGLLVAGIAAVVAIAAIAGVVLLGGGDDGEDDDNGAIVIDREEGADVAFRPESDESSTITFEVPEFWDDVDRRPLEFEDGTTTPDIVVAEDAGAFLDDPEISGAEVTAFDLADAGEIVADDLLSGRADGRGLAARCTSDLPPEDVTFGGIPGLLQRFEGCDGTVIVLFAGVQGNVGVIVEAHLVDEQDEVVLDDVLESLQVEFA